MKNILLFFLSVIVIFSSCKENPITPDTTVKVTGVSLSPTSDTINVAGTQQLTATASPSNATNKTVSWSSSDSSKVTVDSSGIVTGVAAGSAIITVTTEDQRKTATSAITVIAAIVPVTSVSINPTSATISVAGTQQLTATVSPSNATNKTVTWSSSDSSKVTVSSSGIVTGVAAGSATITVTTEDQHKTASSNITVQATMIGWPDATNTGVPANIVSTLTTTSQRTITVDNTVIEGERIIANTFTQYCGGLTIAAKNVIVRNCWITSSFGTGETVNGTGVIKVEPGASVTIEHCTIDGSNRTHAGIWHGGASIVVRGCNIYGTNDGIFAWDADNFTIEDNYLHNFTTESANGHIDGFQTEGGSHGIIRHNHFDITQGQNACVAIWNSRRNSDDILVDNNLMAGGGFTVYAEDYSPSEENPVGGYSVTNIRFTNNAFSTVHFNNVGYWGAWYPRGTTTDKWIRTGNHVYETGENIDNNQPAGCEESMPQ